LYLGSGSPTLNNATSGIINLNTDGSITFANGIGDLVNSGVIKKEATSGEFSISVNTDNVMPGKFICESGLVSFGTYTGDGILTGNGSVKLNSSTVFGGTLSPGGLPGTLTHVGNFTASQNQRLVTEIFGPLPGTQYDVFNVQGNAVVKGNIEVDLNYAAALSHEFVIFNANSISTCELPETVIANFQSQNYTFDVICNPNNVTLKLNKIVLGAGEIKVNKFSLYPNPSNGNFSIDLGKEYSNVIVDIYNVMGQIISSERYSSVKNIQNSINTLPGIYFVNVSTSAGESTNLRIIKQ